MNQNTIESIKWHKDQLSKLLSDEGNFYKIEIELDNVLEKAERGQRTEMRTVRRGGKTFQRKTRVGTKDKATDYKAQLKSVKKAAANEIASYEAIVQGRKDLYNESFKAGGSEETLNSIYDGVDKASSDLERVKNETNKKIAEAEKKCKSHG